MVDTPNEAARADRTSDGATQTAVEEADPFTDEELTSVLDAVWNDL